MKLLPRSECANGVSNIYKVSKTVEKYNPVIAYRPYFTYDAVSGRNISSPESRTPIVINNTRSAILDPTFSSTGFIDLNIRDVLPLCRTFIFTINVQGFEASNGYIFSLANGFGNDILESIYLEYDIVGKSTINYTRYRSFGELVHRTSGFIIPVNVFTTIGIRYSQGSTAEFFINGQRVNSTILLAGSGTFSNNVSNTVTIGNNGSDNFSAFQGYMNELVVFNSLLADEDIMRFTANPDLIFSQSPFLFPVSAPSGPVYVDGGFSLHSGNLFYGNTQTYLYQGRQYAGLPA